jgi:uncharacterized lipoprotein YmbA
MKKHIALSVVLGALLVGCASPGRHHTYEYVIHHGQDLDAVQKKINELGREGWAVQSLSIGDGGYKYVVLKRETTR